MTTTIRHTNTGELRPNTLIIAEHNETGACPFLCSLSYIGYQCSCLSSMATLGADGTSY